MLKPYVNKNLIEAGCDEAGRGCLAGPVVAAAVILPKNFVCKDLNDSKKIPEKLRDELRIYIEKKAIAYAVSFIDRETIDEINILNAAILAMHKALDQLKTRPEYILVDGNRFKKYQQIPHQCIIKGDGKIMSIAAASILAKTYRDDYMKQLDAQYPLYGWKKNKGYATALHRKAITENGITPYHRISFTLTSSQLELDLN